MAAQGRRNKTGKKVSSGSQAVVIFWLIFFIVIVCVFMANAGTIQRNFDLFRARLTSGGTVDEPLPVDIQGPNNPADTSEQTTQRPAPPVTAQPGTPDTPRPQTTEQTNPSAPETAPDQSAQQQTPPVQTRDRAIYFTQIDRDGQILHSRVIRKIPVSPTPMIDVLNAMLAGPTADEINRGFLNFIPRNTKIITATVRGSTAYISFSEDFLFSTFGIEGYVAQLRQVIWTVTEFSNVEDVQILIEGRRMDYLGEGIWIGSPISRRSF
uniref:GerMN domain-containing protein n=1 Tax=uncultured bacterium contig00051 TaxID=1181535 RepID=A0A806KLI4_9BACT|nr:hypothetical protein [uncultured bacterium contig00051]